MQKIKLEKNIIWKLLLDRRKINDKNCWIYLGNIRRDGYGQLVLSGKPYLIHRLSYWINNDDFDLFNTEIKILHKCDKTTCFNPEHLKKGDQRENIQDSYDRNRRVSPSSLKTHCPKGHEYTPENIKIRKRGIRGRAWRECITCIRNR